MAKKQALNLSNLPQKCGVYIFKNAAGQVLYVGKAKRLKNRVVSYFRQSSEHSARIRQMIAQIAKFDFIVTDNETESLILENNLIKKHQPKYNVRLRDDKNYQFIKISFADEIPTISTDRQNNDRRARFFGPYTSSQAVKQTLRLLRSIFPYCANSKVGNKPCFYHQIKKCPGVCIGKISLPEYRDTIEKIMSFLNGRQMQLVKNLQAQMKKFAKQRRFEKAASTRDQLFALNRMLEKQKLVTARTKSQDVFSTFADSATIINLFVVREGKLIQKENFILDNAALVAPAEALKQFLLRYYLDASNAPKELVLPVKIQSVELLRFLQTKFGRKPKIIVPRQGQLAKLLKLGEENAKTFLNSLSDKPLLEEARLMRSLQELQRILKLPKLPGRIEAFDISNIQGTNPVGAMVVFEFGRPKKDQYRRFKIKTLFSPDDFAMLREMLSRRFKNSQFAIRNSQSKPWPLPDLILIDGGKGQLNAAMQALKNANLKSQISVISLAKRLEEIFVPGQPKSLILQPNSQVLFLLQRIRDETHRFAINYHRKLRSKQSLVSELDSLPRIGRQKKQKLIRAFGSPAALKKAPLAQIAAIIGTKNAKTLKSSFRH